MIEPMNDDDKAALLDTLVPLAAELAVAVRDEGPEGIEALLGLVPEGKLPVLCIVLAAMVEPEAPVKALLGWTDGLLPDATELERARLRKVKVSEPAATLLAEYVTRDDCSDLDPVIAAEVVGLTGAVRHVEIRRRMRNREQAEARRRRAAERAVEQELAGAQERSA